MQYIQTVLARIAANRFDAASQPGGLLAELDAHRAYASAQPGFRGMNMTRSANPEGDVLVVVETRWANNNALADYSTAQQNAESIFNAHSGDLAPDSLQVHRMQGDGAPQQEGQARAYDRLALALFVPLGVLAFALVVIYALSRIYLALPSEWATVLAAAVALGVLGVSWYFASHPFVPRWQIAGVAVVVLGTLAIAGTAAAVYDEQNKEVKTVEAQPTPPAGTTPSAPGAPIIDMGDFFFQDASGQKEPTISVTAGQEVTFNVNNIGQAIHNVHVADASGKYTQQFCKVGGPEFCSNPATVFAGGSGKLTVKFDAAGTYDFRCDFHVDQMKGKFEVR